MSSLETPDTLCKGHQTVVTMRARLPSASITHLGSMSDIVIIAAAVKYVSLYNVIVMHRRNPGRSPQDILDTQYPSVVSCDLMKDARGAPWVVHLQHT